MSEVLVGKLQTGFGAASRWLRLFNSAYSEKLGMPVFPGSLNIALDHVFDWFDSRYENYCCTENLMNNVLKTISLAACLNLILAARIFEYSAVPDAVEKLRPQLLCAHF